MTLTVGAVLLGGGGVGAVTAALKRAVLMSNVPVAVEPVFREKVMSLVPAPTGVTARGVWLVVPQPLISMVAGAVATALSLEVTLRTSFSPALTLHMLVRLLPSLSSLVAFT